VSALPLRDRALAKRGIAHGFGVRGAPAPAGLLRPRQVHGATVVAAELCGPPGPAPEADAVVASAPGLSVGVVTADCVPILLVAADGAAVAAVHAGWRGLARGVIAAGVAAVARAARAEPRDVVAAIGPHIGRCCYEVDAPVLDALVHALGAEVEASWCAVREGHALLDLGHAARVALARAGVPEAAIGDDAARCTACDRERFHSYRRDGPQAGRLVHFVEVPARPGPGPREA
jgi:YfiH family protein